MLSVRRSVVRRRSQAARSVLVGSRGCGRGRRIRTGRSCSLQTKGYSSALLVDRSGGADGSPGRCRRSPGEDGASATLPAGGVRDRVGDPLETGTSSTEQWSTRSRLRGRSLESARGPAAAYQLSEVADRGDRTSILPDDEQVAIRVDLVHLEARPETPSASQCGGGPERAVPGRRARPAARRRRRGRAASGSMTFSGRRSSRWPSASGRARRRRHAKVAGSRRRPGRPRDRRRPPSRHAAAAAARPTAGRTTTRLRSATRSGAARGDRAGAGLEAAAEGGASSARSRSFGHDDAVVGVRQGVPGEAGLAEERPERRPASPRRIVVEPSGRMPM